MSNRKNVTKVIRLTPPSLPVNDPSRVIGTVAASRPMRDGEERLESEVFEKAAYGPVTVHHNYGHGRWGMNHSYGSAHLAVTRFHEQMSQQSSAATSTTTKTSAHLQQPVCVLGSGIVGLSTAYILAELGYAVRVYAHVFPKEHVFGARDGAAEQDDGRGLPAVDSTVCSQVAVGIAMPACSAMLEQSRYKAEDSARTHDFFKRCMTLGMRGLKYRYLYDLRVGANRHYDTNGFDGDACAVKVDFGDGRLHDAWRAQVMVIDTCFTMELMDYLKKQKGVQFVAQEFKTKDEVFQVMAKEGALPHLFNCCGIGAKELWGDEKMYPCKGQVLYVRDQKLDYVLYGSTSKGDAHFLPHNDKVVIGSVREDYDWSQQATREHRDQLWDKAIEFLSGIRPKL